MKTHYYFTALLGFMAMTLQAQCDIDPSNTELLAYPDGTTTENDTAWLPTIQDLGYSAVFHLNVPDTITYGGTDVVVEHIQILDVTNIPAGLDYVCNNGDCKFLGNTQGCVEIYGDLDVNAFAPGSTAELDIAFEAEITFGGFPQTLNDEQVEQAIAESGGGNPVIMMKASESFSIEDLYLDAEPILFPNPATHQAVLALSTTKATDLTIQIVDVQGRMLQTVAVSTAVGRQHIELNTQAFAAGVYQIIISNNLTQFSTRLVVE